MSNETAKLGGRLPLAAYSSLSPVQRKLFDHLNDAWVPWAESAGFQARIDDGRLIGPFNPALVHPEITGSFLQLQSAEHMHTSLPERVRQVIILTVGSVWNAEYELYAHSAAARKAGLSDDSIRSLSSGSLPDDLTDQEKIAHQVARQLSVEHQLDEETYRTTEQMFGTVGIVDIAVLTGIYHTVCAMLNTFDIPAPSYA